MPVWTLSTPVLYALELTSRCNGLCPGCGDIFAGEREKQSIDTVPSELDVADWHTILAKISPHAHRLKLTGGEPTLHPQFAEIVQTIEYLGIAFTVFTNALWPDPGEVISLLSSTSQCRGLLISLHGASAASHEAFTQVPGSFEEVTTNIRQAVGHGLKVTVSTVLTRHNFREVREIASLAHSLGAGHVAANRYLGPAHPELELTRDELKQAIQVVEELRARDIPIKFGNCIPQCFTASSSIGCLAGVAYCAIDPQGYMRPCTHAALQCDNLLEVSIEQAWHSPLMQRWREMIPGQCHECAAFSQCHGGCRAMMLQRNARSDPLAGEPLSECTMPMEPVVLYEGLRLISSWEKMRPESFGYVLMRGNRVLPVPSAAQAILDACDGQTTLRDIHTRFGQPGLEIVVELAEKGVIELA
jgi:radical SAM protein with 4Fe4S-binding SPASM domain